MRTRLLYMAILLGGLVMSYISIAQGVDGIKSCDVLASGDACVFDIEATDDGTIQVNTQASLEGERWRVTIVETNEAPAISNVGTGSTMDFTGSDIMKRRVFRGLFYHLHFVSVLHNG